MFRKTLLLILFSIFVFTCKSGRESEKTESEKNSPVVAGNDGDPSKHFDLTPETVVIRHGAEVVRKISPDRSTFTLDGSAENVQELAPGKVMLIPGVDAGKVTSIRKEGKDVVVTVGAVKITDVIRNGTIQWEPKDVDVSRGMWMTTEAGATISSSLEPLNELPRFTPNGIFESVVEAGAAPQNKVKLTVGDWKIELTFTDGSFTLYAAKQKFPLWCGVTAKMEMGKPQTSGQVVVQQGNITDTEIDMPAEGYVEVDATSHTESGPAFPGKAVIEIPLEWVIPIETPFFIPFYVGFKVNFLFQPEIPTKNTVMELKLHSDFRGNMGFGYTRGALLKKTKLVFEDNPIPEISGTPSMGDVAALVALQMPRVAVGLGARSVASTGMFIDLVSAVTVNVASATSMFPCRSVTLTETASAGFEYEVGPDIFKAIVKKLQQNTKLKGEVHKVELQKWSPSVAWYQPHINACRP